MTGAALALAIELLQFWVPWRNPSAADIATNTLGAFVGSAVLSGSAGNAIRRRLAAVEQWTRRLIAAEPRRASYFSLVWALNVAAVLAATAVLLTSALPDPPYVVPSPFIDASPGPLRIGSNGEPDGFFKGLIDEVRIYARPRSAEAIQADMWRRVAANTSSEPNLVAAYGFNEGIGALAHDDSGGGHHGALSGTTWTNDGRFGGALSFDGTSNEVIIPPAPDLELRGGVTLEAWVFPIGDPSLWPAVIEQANDAYYIYGSSDSGRFLAAGGGRFGGSSEDTRAIEPMPVRDWTHLAMTYDTKAIRLYVNGRLASSRVRWSTHRPSSAMLNGAPLPAGVMADPGRLRTSLLGSTTLGVTLNCGYQEPPPAPVFLILGRAHADATPTVDVLSLIAEGADLLVRSPTLGLRLGLPSPDYRVPNAFSACVAGRTLQLTLTGPRQSPRVDVNGQEVRGTGRTLGSGWAFLIHSELLPVRIQESCTLAWLALLLLPFGFWARARPASAIGAGILLLAFHIVSDIWHLPRPGMSELTSGLTGVFLGMICRSQIRRGQRATTGLRNQVSSFGADDRDSTGRS